MSTLKTWLVIFRIHTLSASYIPVIFGTLYARYRWEVFEVSLFLSMLIASILIQMATNLFNDYFDHRRGIDTRESVGKSTALVTGEVRPSLILFLALSFTGASGLLGLYIILNSSLWIALIGAASILAGFFYSAGPRPISATPYGEIFAGFFMGHVIIGISYFIQTGRYDLPIFLVSLPFALLIAAILTANNIRDLEEDVAGGRRTLAILLGKEKAIRFLTGISWMAFIVVPLFIFMNLLPIFSLAVFLSAGKIGKAAAIFRSNHTPPTRMPAMVLIAKNNVLFGVLMIASLLLDRLFQ